MSTYFMLGNYSVDAIKGVCAERTNQAINLIKKFGGEVTSMHALLGGFDLVIIADFPGTEEAMKASIALSKLTDISFSTFPAVSVEKFDEMVREL